MVEKIENMNFEELNTNIKLAMSKEITWKPKLDAEFLNHCLPVLASIPLVENRGGKLDAKMIMQAMDTGDKFTTPNGAITGHNLRYLISFLYKCPRGDLLPGSQTKHPTLAAFTPLVLYANKLYNQVPYSKWDKKSFNMPLFLGYKLQSILEVKENPIDYDVLDLRTAALAYGPTAKKAGELAPLTGYKMNIKKIDDIEYPNIVLMMYLQVWLANAAVRDTSSMILDPVNWDFIPDAVDIIHKSEIPAVALDQTL